MPTACAHIPKTMSHLLPILSDSAPVKSWPRRSSLRRAVGGLATLHNKLLGRLDLAQQAGPAKLGNAS